MSEKEIKTEELKETVEKTENLAVEEKVAPSDAEKKKKAKKIKRQISKGKASIKCTYNNTMVTLSDSNGQVLAWATSGLLGFKGAKKATPYAATQVVANVAEKVRKYGLKELEVYVKGVGSGREASIRALANNGFDLILIKDITPIPHNGCRPKKPRRV
ncbi:MAG: 30S ribosomal protein S11 [Parcubacteria group bacterium]|jgi:small subunit ribosomal protein S11